MGKIVAYECDLCGTSVKSKNNVIILSGTIFNGEDEIVFDAEDKLMICNNCLINNIVDTELPNNPTTVNDNLDEIRELITPNNNFINSEPFLDNIKDTINDSFLDNIKDTINDENLIIPDNDFTLKENNDIIPLTENNTHGQTKDPEVFNLLKIVPEMHSEIINYFGYSTIDDFYEQNNIKTLDNVFMVLESDYDISIDDIMKTHSMSIESILVYSNNKTSIKKASVFVLDDKGYISKDILNQLYSV